MLPLDSICKFISGIFHLGPVDPSKTKFERHSSIVICCVDVSSALYIQPRDSFQNLCLTQSALKEGNSRVNLDLYHSVVTQVNAIP